MGVLIALRVNFVIFFLAKLHTATLAKRLDEMKQDTFGSP
jgi:hypothetical protein